ncbi:catalase/peroxidase HPI [Pseudomonas sp. P66]|uniref:Catalase-peroxidase n=1 Tax=Pseudomonas arcuscaelestis TaxID=2710591 RepID=A0ABS2C1W5_9PSED|nr:catalase/peroxidase HPI [Pseudomonas arcuscaelestis]MBM5459857.1 catalase/peroxidase HPI [Pseudomonas arcuscaelestis]
MRMKQLPLAIALIVGFSPIVHADNTGAASLAGKHQQMTNKDWWPNRLDLSLLRQHNPASSPADADFNYAKAFNSLDLSAVKKDIEATLTQSQDWWPADYGNYGPFFIRMAWHSAGTYRTLDGRGGSDGGQQRFDPLNNWPDNVSLDKARRLLWPVKEKYGASISWGDLMVLAGTVAMESMGMKTYGFGGGREDDWEPDLVYWGPESTWLGDERYHGKRELNKPLAAVQMGLIYVNPEGPNGKPDPLAAAKDIRDTFARMGMNDEETVALIAGGHTFGKAHGAHKPEGCLGADPASAPTEQQGLGWKNTCGKGNAEDTITSGLEGAWTSSPANFTNQYLANLFGWTWVQTKSPAGAIQWIPSDPSAAVMVPDAHVKDKRHAPIMFTTDLALRFDPAYEKVSRHFLDNPKAFELAFAKAWFKLTHRDLGPRTHYLGADVPKEDLIWQDPIPALDHKLIDTKDIEALKTKVLASGLSTGELVRTAWASASSFRGSDMRGGANGARLRLAPQKDWNANNPAELSKVLAKLEAIQKDFNSKLKGGKQVSLADVIVIAGSAAVESAAKKGGFNVQIPVTLGRMDTTQDKTDINSFAVLEPKADGFRNYYSADARLSPTEMLVDKASLLTLTAPEMTVLVGGMRALGANTDGSKNGVLTAHPGTLSNDFFVNLMDMSTVWSKSSTDGLYEGRDRKTGEVKWSATPVDLVFGSNSELRAVSEFYAANDAKEKFVKDFAKAWTKVMNLDRFDI